MNFILIAIKIGCEKSSSFGKAWKLCEKVFNLLLPYSILAFMLIYFDDYYCGKLMVSHAKYSLTLSFSLL
jgi:hypothetical protein